MKIRDALLAGPLGFGAVPLGNMFRNIPECSATFPMKKPLRPSGDRFTPPGPTSTTTGSTRRRDHPLTYRPDHEGDWFPQQKPTEVSMLKCNESVTDGSVSRWSFHTACIDPTSPANARCRKSVVVRSFVFF